MRDRLNCCTTDDVLLSTVRISLTERNRPDVVRLLRILKGHAEAKAGCLEFHVSQDLTDADVLTITERWATRTDLDAHLRSADYKLLLAAIDLGTTPPEIQFDLTEPIGGLNVVSTVRSGQDKP
jgi:quinol monooxygenase YgiN